MYICCVHAPHDASKTTFSVPKNEGEKGKWEKALGIVLKKSHRVCAKHFETHEIKSTWESGEGLNKYTICLKIPRLVEGAVPKSFEKHADSLNVFKDTYEDLLANDNVILKWVCSFHKSEILTEIYTMYIVMRMRQYSYMKNIESKQINKAKKKLPKLVPT